MQNGSADELDVEVTHVEDTASGFAADGEGFLEQVVKRLAVFDALLEFDGFLGQLGVGELLEGGFEIVDLGDEGAEPLDFAFVPGAENFRKSSVEHGRARNTPNPILADLANFDAFSG